MTARLNIGAGGIRTPGWLSLDRAGADLDYTHDLRDPLPFGDCSVDMIAAHHVLDLLDADDVNRLLGDLCRVLKPGGVLRISLFDIRKAAEAVECNDTEWFARRGAPEVDLFRQFRWIIYLNGARKWVSTPFLLGLVLEAHGFRQYKVEIGETICSDDSICELDSRPDESFYIEGVK